MLQYRFNFSHGDLTTHGACLDRLRQAVAQRPGCHVAVMLGLFTNLKSLLYFILVLF